MTSNTKTQLNISPTNNNDLYHAPSIHEQGSPQFIYQIAPVRKGHFALAATVNLTASTAAACSVRPVSPTGMAAPHDKQMSQTRRNCSVSVLSDSLASFNAEFEPSFFSVALGIVRLINQYVVSCMFRLDGNGNGNVHSNVGM